jgi:hypothetical protein
MLKKSHSKTEVFGCCYDYGLRRSGESVLPGFNVFLPILRRKKNEYIPIPATVAPQ